MEFEDSSAQILHQIEEALVGVPTGYIKPSEMLDENLFQYNKLGIVIDPEELLEDPEQDNGKKSGTNFNGTNTYKCSDCKRVLPTAHILDLHVQEQHDMYFAASVDRGNKPMFSCYLELCDLKFFTTKERKDHCIRVHKFPSNFRYDQCRTKNRNRCGKKGNSMDVDEELKQPPHNIKAFTFGHTSERTFDTRKQHAGKTLTDVKAMKDAIDEIMM